MDHGENLNGKKCNVTSKIHYDLEWKRRGTMTVNSPRISQKTDGTLIIERVRPSDESKYVCIARNIGGVTEHSIDLLVQSHPELTISARMNHRDVIGDVISFKAGTTITMMCNADGFPKPRVHWRKDGYPIRRRSVHLRVYGGQLKLFRARKVDAGVYSCHASNKAGNTDKSISLRFLEPPQIFGLLNYTLIEEDQTFRTACKVKGFPQEYFQSC